MELNHRWTPKKLELTNRNTHGKPLEHNAIDCFLYMIWFNQMHALVNFNFILPLLQIMPSHQQKSMLLFNRDAQQVYPCLQSLAFATGMLFESERSGVGPFNPNGTYAPLLLNIFFI